MEIFRTFIGIEIKPERDFINAWNTLRVALSDESIKWVDSKTIHLTLLFLGETPRYKVRDISTLLKANLSEFSTFKINLKGFGTFGKPNPKVIWVGAEPSKNLPRLKEIVDDTLMPFGYEDENKIYTPHITLGRIKHLSSKVPIVDFVEKNKGSILQEVFIERVTFYQSKLTPLGPLYFPLEVFNLK